MLPDTLETRDVSSLYFAIKEEAQTVFSANLKHARTHVNVSQAQLARMAGLSRGQVYKLEKKVRLPNGLTFVLIAAALGLPLAWFMEKHEEVEYV